MSETRYEKLAREWLKWPGPTYKNAGSPVPDKASVASLAELLERCARERQEEVMPNADQHDGSHVVAGASASAQTREQPKTCPKCGGTEHLNDYVGVCEDCYNDPRRNRYYVSTKGGLATYVMQEIPGNNIVICETVHGEPDAEMIADALNAWRDRYK